jgi:HK97 gp10 family phage protein
VALVSVKFEGGAQLAKNLEALPAALRGRVLRDALREGAELIRARASQLAPRAPGAPDLADAIVVGKVRANADEAAAGAVLVGIGVPKRFFYDAMLEFGTKHMPAQAFYRPALDQEGGRAIKVIGAGLWAALAKAGGTGGRGSSSGGGLL